MRTPFDITQSRCAHSPLSTVFDKLQYDAAILLEDDLEVAPDFFSYFAATLPLLERDPSLYCVSAWNDNGNPDFVDKNHHRTRPTRPAAAHLAQASCGARTSSPAWAG